jgi:hypothetical protein
MRYPEPKQSRSQYIGKPFLDQTWQPQYSQQTPITPSENKSDKRNTERNKGNKPINKTHEGNTQIDGILQNNTTSSPATKKSLGVKASSTHSKDPRAKLGG